MKMKDVLTMKSTLYLPNTFAQDSIPYATLAGHTLTVVFSPNVRTLQKYAKRIGLEHGRYSNEAAVCQGI